MQATLNVRIDGIVKERGDRVLQANGISTSAAIRALWEYLGSSQELPSFLHEAAEEVQAKKRKKAALQLLAGVAEGACSDLSDEQMHALWMSRYE